MQMRLAQFGSRLQADYNKYGKLMRDMAMSK